MGLKNNHIPLLSIAMLLVWQATFSAVIDLSGWTTFSPSQVFTAPHFARDGQTLVITPLDNTNTFGYWVSPGNIFNTEPGYLYHLEWKVAGDVTPLFRSPSFRLRVNSQNYQQADIFGVESLNNGEWMPPSTALVYSQYFLPATSANLAELAFDGMNFSPDNATRGSIALNFLEVERISLSGLSRTLIAEWEFSADTEGWSFNTLPEYFTEPIGEWENGSLKITATDNTNNFGFWTSPTDEIHTTPGKLYNIEFTIRTDIAEPEHVPDLRVRVNTSDWEAYVAQVITSCHNAEESPTLVPRNYSLYIYIPELAGYTSPDLSCSFDLMNFDPANSPTGALYLDRVAVYEASLP